MASGSVHRIPRQTNTAHHPPLLPPPKGGEKKGFRAAACQLSGPAGRKKKVDTYSGTLSLLYVLVHTWYIRVQSIVGSVVEAF